MSEESDYVTRFRERIEHRQRELNDAREVLAALERAQEVLNLVTADRDRLYALAGAGARADLHALEWCRRHNCLIRCNGAANPENSTLTVAMPNGTARSARILAEAVGELRAHVEGGL